MKTPAALVLILLAALCAPLEAQQQQGDTELAFSGSILTTVGQENVSTTSGIVQAKVGYFVSDRVELGVFPSLRFTETTVETQIGEEEFSETDLGVGAFGTYSFLAEDAMTVPYVGGQFYRIDVTNEDETGWLGVNGGVKIYVNRNTAFDMGGNYLVGLGQSDGALMLFQVGLNFLL